MSEENTTKPEGASNAGGATAEAYINEQLVKARKSLNSTRIAMSVVALIVLSYMSFITVQIGKFTDPETAADLAMGYAKPQVDNYTSQLLEQVDTKIPEMLAPLPDKVLESLPEYRQNLQTKIVDSMRTYAEQTSTDMGEQLDAYLEAHGDSIADLLKTADDPEAGQEFAKAISEQILGYLDHKTPDGESLREKLDISLIALQGVQNHVAYLAKSDTLNKHEQNQRRVIAILVRTVEQELARTASGQNLLGL